VEATRKLIEALRRHQSALDSSDTIREALGRLPRADSKTAVLYKIIFAAKTVEERVRRNVQKKLSCIDLLNDGDLIPGKRTTDEIMKNTSLQIPTEEQLFLFESPEYAARRNGRLSHTPAHQEREHSAISPSRLKNIEICPGFVDDTRAEVHPDTAQGTLCHEALDSGDDSALNDEQRGWVKACRDFIGDLLRDHYATELREERLDILGDVWGFADDILLSKDGTSGALIDFKFGVNAQEDAETNPAAQAYVLGMFQRWPQLETIDVYYLYPRREEASHAQYTRQDVEHIKLRLETIIARVKSGPTYSPTPEVCTWCGKKATCAALHAAVLPLAMCYGERKGMAIPPSPDFSLVKDPHTWSRLMGLVPVLEAMIDSIKRRALEFRQELGVEIPGYEVRQRSGRKTINNAVIAWHVLSKAGLTTLEQFLRAVDVSVKRLADAAGENAPRGQKAKAVAHIEGKLRDAGVLEVGPETLFLARAK
jgi:hypothetical protein